MNNSSCSDSEDDHHKMKWSDHFCGECNNLIKTNHNYSCVTCDLKTQTIKRDERNMTAFQKQAKVIDDKTDQEWQPKASDYLGGGKMKINLFPRILFSTRNVVSNVDFVLTFVATHVRVSIATHSWNSP